MRVIVSTSDEWSGDCGRSDACVGSSSLRWAARRREREREKARERESERERAREGFAFSSSPDLK